MYKSLAENSLSSPVTQNRMLQKGVETERVGVTKDYIL